MPAIAQSNSRDRIDLFHAALADPARGPVSASEVKYFYWGDEARDRAEIAGLARDLRLEVVRDGTRDFALSDGDAYLLRRPE